jgi:hypothetical protein
MQLIINAANHSIAAHYEQVSVLAARDEGSMDAKDGRG